MQRTKVRDWCSWKLGDSPVLIIAPHGGRRTAGAPSARLPLRVNDLHTAQLARELAQAVDGSFVVNTDLDRNELDLNRTSQVLRGAPWLLQLLESILDEILRHHATAEVLFIHGWNVIQAKCDIGIGAALAAEDQAQRQQAVLTVSPDYVEERLGTFRALCARAGVKATYGERYPARHRDNLLQIFRRAGRAADVPPIERLRGWAQSGRVQAVQLELGVPLRWPGDGRQRFLAAARDAFSLPQARRPSMPPQPRTKVAVASLPVALQLYDPDSGIGLMSSIFVSSERGSLGSRLLLLLGERSLALFVGEDPETGGAGYGGPRFETRGSALHLEFDGSLLALEDADLYIDVERAFASSRLLPARVDLTFRPAGGSRYGCIEGRLETGGGTTVIRAFGFADASLQQRPIDLSRSALSLSASFGSGLAYLLRAGSGPHRALRITPGGEEERTVNAARVDLAEDRSTPRRFEVRLDGESLFGEPVSRVAILRPLPGGRTARTTFGVARFRLQPGASGFGFYDYSCVVTRR